jgi:hypothetical protein
VARLVENGSELLGEGMGVAWPASRHVIAVYDDVGRPGVAGAVTVAPVVLDAGVWVSRVDVDEVLRPREGSCDLGLHRHIAGRVAGWVGVCALVAGFPEAHDAADGGGEPLLAPGQRSGPPAVQNRATGGGIDGAGGEQHAMADRGDGQFAPERLHDHCLENRALQVGTHSAGAVTTRKKQPVDSVEVNVVPAHRGDELRRGSQLGVGRATGAVGPKYAPEHDEAAQP